MVLQLAYKKIKKIIKALIPYIAVVKCMMGFDKTKAVFLKGTIDEMRYTKEACTVLFLPDDAMNTVEKNLPALIFAKEHYEFNFVVLIHEQKLLKRLMEEKILFKYLKEYADVVIFLDSDKNCLLKAANGWKYTYNIVYEACVRERVLNKALKDVKIDVLVRIWSYYPIYDYFYNNHTETKHIAIGHGSTYIDSPAPALYQDETFYKADLWLFPDDYTYRGTNKEILSKAIVIGAPSYDLWWIKKFDLHIASLKKMLYTSRKTILILMPSLRFGEDLFSKQTEQAIIKFIKHNKKKYNIIIKFHPREEVVVKQEYLQMFNRNDENDIVYTSDIMTVALANLADCAISCGMTTALMDVLINGVPVIELYREGNPCSGYHYEIGEGKWGTFFRKEHITIYASDYSSLSNAVNSVLYKDGWGPYREQYKKYVYLDNNASKRMADAIIQMVHYGKIIALK